MAEQRDIESKSEHGFRRLSPQSLHRRQETRGTVLAASMGSCIRVTKMGPGVPV